MEFKELLNDFSDSFVNSFFDISTENILFIKFLLFIMFFLIINHILKKSHVFKNNKSGTAIISLCISLLAAYYAPEEWIINYIIIPYGSLALVLVLFLPLILILFFIHRAKINFIVRRVILLVYGVFVGISWTKSIQDISPVGEKIYIAVAAAIILSIFFDKALNKLFKKKMKTK